MARFRLLASLHEAWDLSAEPDANGRFPPRTFRAGEIVESDRDLVAQFGSEKFQLVDGGTTPLKPAPPQAATVFPGGQVATGRQETTKGPDGRSISGPENMNPAQRAEVNKNQPPVDDLDHMSVKELQDHAAAEEIDLRGAKNKEDLVKAIRSTRRK